MRHLEELIKTIEILRSPEGCKWDREQTHSTLKTNMLEEAYEAVEAINTGDMENLKEELGDVLLQVILHSQIAKEEGAFDIEDVADEINKKLIRRHPHVFSGTKVNGVEDILNNWEDIKKQEKPERASVLDGITKGQASLITAYKISKKAVKVGFEWTNDDELWEQLESELNEFKEAKTQENKEEELGDILFTVVNIARRNNVDPEQALIKTNEKFTARFKEMEKLADKELEELTFDEWNELWAKAKKNLKSK
ncbi:nucleoside triphosphate pyrophosphohydrolase [bacterium]|nr:nucleoside triphosphate pyrophosphohydrolase [bacterium]